MSRFSARPGYALDGSTARPIFSSSAPDLRGGRPIPPGHGIEWHSWRAGRIGSLIARATACPLGESVELAAHHVLPGRRIDNRGHAEQADRHQDPPGTLRASDPRCRGERIERAGLPQQPPGFERAPPLWFYILLESQQRAGGERLGPVGARIVAEVFLTNLQRDPGSYLSADPGFQPSVPHEGAFTMGDFLHFAGVV